MSNVEIVFWDVQHGHSSYIKTPNGRHIVIDLGTGSYGGSDDFSPLKLLKNKYKVTQLDYVVLTHPHVDHINDIFCFDDMAPKVLLRPKHLDREPILEKASDKDKPKLLKYFEISDRYSEQISDSSPNSIKNPQNWGGLSIKTFVPSNCGQSNLNNHSAVAVFEFEGIKALIPGDNEPASWNELIKIPGFVSATKDIDLLLAPHHGRKSGFDNETKKHFNPRLTVVSDGPFCETSATPRYSEISRGWKVHKRSGGSEDRYCLTTRKDGVVVGVFGKSQNGNSFLEITAD